MNKVLVYSSCLVLAATLYACSGDDEGDEAQQQSEGGAGSGGRANATGGVGRGGSSSQGGTGGAKAAGASSATMGGANQAGASAVGGGGGATPVDTAGTTSTLDGSSSGGTSGGVGGQGVAGQVLAGRSNIDAAGNAGHAESNAGAAGALAIGGWTGLSTGGTLATAGNTATGGAIGTGGKAATGGAAGTGGAIGTGGKAATGGAIGTGGAVGTGGKAATGGALATGGTSAAGSSGVAGTPSVCSGLCGGTTCAQTPACLEDAYGLSQGDSIPICVPKTSIALGAVTICGGANCNDGSVGCPMTAQIGATAWTLAASGTAGTTDVSLDTTVTGLTGDIGTTGLLTCTLQAAVPSAGLAVTATGAAAATTAGDRSLVFESPLTAPLTGLTVTSTTSASCANNASLYITAAYPSLRTALLEALNARAQALRCLDCRGDCPQQLACVER